MKKIGFIGLGIMGGPMAGHLLNAGYEMTVYNRTLSKAKPLAEKGAKIAASPADVARDSEVVIIMVKADAEVQEVLWGEKGVVAGAAPALTVINSSTISPKTSIKLAQELPRYGIEILDAPVTGSGVQAREAKLTFMAGGKKEVFSDCLPLFHVMGKQAFYMGQSGTGSYAKIANNVMLAINLLSVAEGLTIATKAGIDPETFAQVVAGGGARSGMLETKTPKIVKRDFSPAFGTAMLYKDLGLAYDLAKELEVPTPVLAAAREVIRIALNKGLAEEDVCSVVKCYEEWAGIRIRQRE
ncbi:MAG: NAD(P)-dependent oxidoreductase [Syntrophomonadaceae bacterium]|nr:NAD(P)-dependent oxidoreductase [Syntrophomonadaceae bacterium]